MPGMDAVTHGALFDLSGRTAIVTGGSRGIGRSIAETFVLSGANVVVTSRKAEPCEETVEHLRSLGGHAVAMPAHMGDPDTPGRLVDAAVSEWGGLDIVVNNAANPLAAPIADQDVGMWQKTFEVNLRGPALLTKAAIDPLTASGHGRVINIISVGAFSFSAGLSLYSSMKAGLNAFTKAAAAEFADRNILVNAIAPGWTDTYMVANLGAGEGDQKAVGSLLGRLASPDEVAAAALFLAGDASSYVTGQVMFVDGGLHPH